MNISSIIIRAKTQDWSKLLEMIGKVEYVEVALDDEARGVVIAIIQAPSTHEDIDSLKQLSKIKGVVSADMHLTYSDEEFRGCEVNMQEIAELIDTQPVEQMKYSGDVQNLLKS